VVGVRAPEGGPSGVSDSHLERKNTLLSERSTGSSAKQKSADDVAAAIDQVITLLHGGLEAFKAPSTTRRR
jgi:hypothetical protein